MKMEEIHKFMLKLLALGLQTKRTYVRSHVFCWGTPPKLQTKTLAFYVETFALGAPDKAHMINANGQVQKTLRFKKVKGMWSENISENA